jgi:hypothetical protein
LRRYSQLASMSCLFPKLPIHVCSYIPQHGQAMTMPEIPQFPYVTRGKPKGVPDNASQCTQVTTHSCHPGVMRTPDRPSLRWATVRGMPPAFAISICARGEPSSSTPSARSVPSVAGASADSGAAASKRVRSFTPPAETAASCTDGARAAAAANAQAAAVATGWCAPLSNSATNCTRPTQEMNHHIVDTWFPFPLWVGIQSITISKKFPKEAPQEPLASALSPRTAYRRLEAAVEEEEGHRLPH